MSPLSRDPEARARQLANLRSGAHAANLIPGAGQRAAVRANTDHGGYAAIAAERLDAKVREIYDLLAADAPLRDAHGRLPRHDAPAMKLLAEDWIHLDEVRADIRAKGWLDQQTGELRPVVAHEDRLARRVVSALADFGMTPKSRAALGLDLARTVDLATAMSEPDPELRRSLLRQAGVSVDGEEAEGV